VLITRGSVLAWRQRRQFLEPYGDADTPAIVHRLCGVQAQVGSAADLAVALRQVDPQPGTVAQALADRALVKTWAMRGTLHAVHPAQAGAFLALLADARTWERPAWQRAFVTTGQLDRLTDVVREALDGPPVSREELVAAVERHTGDADLVEHLRSGWGAVLKPVAWQGYLCHGPAQGNRVTFTRPDAWVPGWAGLPDADEAARIAIPAYLSAYGPATSKTFDRWLTRGATPAGRLKRWFAELGDEIATVEVEGVPALARAADVDQIAAARPGKTVRLLPGFDQYVLAPGPATRRSSPPGGAPSSARRPAGSRRSSCQEAGLRARGRSTVRRRRSCCSGRPVRSRRLRSRLRSPASAWPWTPR
jgi:hypothetical protein